MELRKGESASILGSISTAETVRAHYQPSNAYRISESRYPSGTDHCGTSRGGFIFVLEGSIDLTLDQVSEDFTTASAGEYFEKPLCGYRLRVSEPTGARLVWVFQIPERYRAAAI